MFSYRRLNEILIYLNNKVEPVSLEELVNFFHVSERTMRSDIQNINAVLSHHGAIVDRLRKKGYFLSIENQDKYNEFIEHSKEPDQIEDLDNASKRIQYVLQYLLFHEAFTTQEELADLVYVSRNTIINYIKTIKIMISEYDLHLESKANLGIRILGDEIVKRRCFMELIVPHDLHSMIIGFTKEEERIFEGIDLQEIESIVLAYAKEYNVRFSDFNLRNLIMHFALLISRLRANCPLHIAEHAYDLEYDLKPLVNRIEEAFQIKIPEEEMQYLYSHFMSNAKTMYKFEENKRHIKNLIDNFLMKINSNYNFDLCHDQILMEDLTHHFQSILNTKRYHLNKRNPLLNTIKANYPLAYDITLTSMHEVLEKEPFQLTDDEIGYISLHIGAAIERCFNAPIKKKSIIIVCGSGYATSRMLEAKLNNIFKDKLVISGRYSYHEYMQMELHNIDFVISTIPLEEKNIPVVLVDFSLFNHNIESITKMITHTGNEDYRKIDNFFEESLFFHYDTIQSKGSLIHNLCIALQNQGYINEDFEASVLKREAIAATNMDEVLAIPHPMDPLATHTKVSVALLKEPLQWNEKSSVRIILLLAINKYDQQNIEHLYDSFIQIMNQPQMQHQILNCRKFSEFINILHRYSEFTENE